MCGLVGYWSASPVTCCSEMLVEMAAKIKSRGPDAYGDWCDRDLGIGLAHRRLSVIDLSAAGTQPMQSSCGRLVIVFNGEIYNHWDLRDALHVEGCSVSWRGHSDTETLLECFSAWGVHKTLQKVVGMFAFALWDTEKRILTLGRDRLGEKPLYWGWCNDVLLFGSDLAALKAHPAFNAVIDRTALALLLKHNYIPSPFSIYQGIEKLPAGHFVEIRERDRRSDVVPIEYWSLHQKITEGLSNPFKGNTEDAISVLEAKLEESVRLQMLADVPLGAFLSGGVDSSTVVALMQRQSNNPICSFAIGFNEKGYNEAEYARLVAKHLGTDHTELYVNAEDALAVIPRLPEIYSEPFADSSQIPTFLVSQLAKQHVTVALTGDGGDELFGGYNPYQFAPRIWRMIRALPLSARRALVSVIGQRSVPNKLNKLLEVFPAQDRVHFYDLLMSYWQNPADVVIGAGNAPSLMRPLGWALQEESFEHLMMAIDAALYMPDDILVKVDRAAMANSLETRVPLLDHRVVEFAWRLPLDLKIREGEGKWLLRQVLYRHVPRELIERPKKGFSVPLGRWLRGPLKDWAATLLDENRLQQEGFFESSKVRRLWCQHLDEKMDHSRKLWSVLMFQAWLEKQ